MSPARSDLHIRRATPQDMPGVLDFVQATYGDGAPFKDRARHSWQYENAPFTPKDDTGPTIWLAMDGSRVVGTIGVQDGAFRIDGQSIPAGWIVDVMVHPDYRGKRLGHLIHDAVMRERPVLITLTMAVATRRIAERAGCLTLGPTHLFIRPHRLSAQTVARYLAYKSHFGGRARAWGLNAFNATRVGPWIVARAGRIRDWAVRRKAPAEALDEFEVRETDHFPDDVAGLWQRVAPRLEPVFERSPGFLNWRFVDCPGLAYRRFLLYREGVLAGYLVTRVGVREEQPLGVVADIFADPEDDAALDALLELAGRVLVPETEYLEAAASHPAWQAALRRAGFIATRTMYPTIVCTDKDLRDRLSRTTQAWHFTKADHDWDQIHPI